MSDIRSILVASDPGEPRSLSGFETMVLQCVGRIVLVALLDWLETKGPLELKLKRGTLSILWTPSEPQ